MMGASVSRLFVCNLPFSATEAELREFVAQVGGEIVDCRILVDRYTGRSRGCGFVELRSEDEALRALAALDGALLGGRPIRIEPARERR